LVFLDLLAKEVLQQDGVLYAFCLMGNHYHLLLETPEPNLVQGIRRLNGVYTQAFNRRPGRRAAPGTGGNGQRQGQADTNHE
jgi:putative transposase